MKLEAELEIPTLFLVIFHRPQFEKPWNIQIWPLPIFIVNIIIFSFRHNQIIGSVTFMAVTNVTGAIFVATIRILIPCWRFNYLQLVLKDYAH